MQKETIQEPEVVIEEVVPEIVYDNLTLDQLVSKLNINLNSTLANTGDIFARYSLEKNVDPYLAVAIVLQETGCSWNCSEMVKQCNNVGGMKGYPGCWGGSYMAFDTLEAGIKSYIDNLASNYYAYGLTTPELMNSKYAESTEWATLVNNYIYKIKNS